MTTIANLRRHRTVDWSFLDPDIPPPPPGDLLDPIPSSEEMGLVLQLTISQPKSLAGRNVVLVVDPSEVDWLLRQVRSEAIRQRSRPERWPA